MKTTESPPKEIYEVKIQSTSNASLKEIIKEIMLEVIERRQK